MMRGTQVMGNTDASRRWVLRVSALAMVLTTVAACTNSPISSAPSADSIGMIRETDQGTALTIPAMWAAKQSDGSIVGGIEPAEVLVAVKGDGQFTVDLSTIESRGAGPQWEAATAQAAAVGTLLSASDPSKIDLGFTITGPIDGPSAGGLLTVGVLAAINRDPLLPHVTMTGTISPDGSIGAVGYVPTKVAAAAQAGYTTIVVPSGPIQVTNADGSTQPLAEYAATLGVRIIPVRTVNEAYKELTGSAYVPIPAVPVVASPQSGAAITATTRTMLARLTAAITTAPTGTDEQAIARARSAIPRMKAAMAKGEWDRAYGLGAFSYLRLARESGAARVESTLSTSGIVKAEIELRAATTAALQDAIEARDSAIDSTPLLLEKALDLPGALGWATYAIASYRGILLELDQPNDKAALIAAGRVLAEESAGVKDMLPDALQVLNAMPSRTSITAEELRSFLAGYSVLLRSAGQANTDYLAALIARSWVADGTVSDDGLIGANQVLQSSASNVTPGSATEALAQCADALTFYVVSNGLVSGHQAYAITGTSSSHWTSPVPLAIDSAVDTGAATIEAYGAILRARGLTVGYPLWSSRWGRAAALEYRGRAEATDSGWLALNETWYDAVSMFMVNAKTQS